VKSRFSGKQLQNPSKKRTCTAVPSQEELYLAAAADSSGGGGGGGSVRGSEPRGRRSGRRLRVGSVGGGEVVESRAGHERLKASEAEGELNKRKKEKPTQAGRSKRHSPPRDGARNASRGEARVHDV